MKKLLLLFSAALLALPAAAQETDPEERDLKLMVRNRKGRTMHGLELSAQVKGAGRLRGLDGDGNLSFRVSEGDTLLLLTGAGDIYELPTDGFDSIQVVFRNRSRIAGIAPESGGDDLINIGYGTISRHDNITSVSQLDTSNTDGYTDLRSYIQGRVAGVAFIDDQLVIRGINSFNSGIEALVVVDGVAWGSFAAVNASITPRDVASISVLKDGGSTAIYGVRGANGVVLIATKRGGDN